MSKKKKKKGKRKEKLKKEKHILISNLQVIDSMEVDFKKFV